MEVVEPQDSATEMQIQAKDQVTRYFLIASL